MERNPSSQKTILRNGKRSMRRLPHITRCFGKWWCSAIRQLRASLQPLGRPMPNRFHPRERPIHSSFGRVRRFQSCLGTRRAKHPFNSVKSRWNSSLNKRSWVLEHPQRYSDSTRRKARSRTESYRREYELFFVQYLGPTENFLWLGDLVSDRLLHCFHKENHSDPDYMGRRRLARERGFPLGCRCGRPGLLNAPPWLAGTEEPGDCLFDREALRLALLFGTTLAVLFLTHGMAVNTLLQLSRDRWVETPSGRQQWLLPGTGKSDADRCLFPIHEARGFLS